MKSFVFLYKSPRTWQTPGTRPETLVKISLPANFFFNNANDDISGTVILNNTKSQSSPPAGSFSRFNFHAVLLLSEFVGGGSGGRRYELLSKHQQGCSPSNQLPTSHSYKRNGVLLLWHLSEPFISASRAALAKLSQWWIVSITSFLLPFAVRLNDWFDAVSALALSETRLKRKTYVLGSLEASRFATTKYLWRFADREWTQKTRFPRLNLRLYSNFLSRIPL